MVADDLPNSNTCLRFRRWKHEAKNGIVTCSALRQSYRRVLCEGYASPKEQTTADPELETRTCLTHQVLFVYLKGTKEIISKRLGARKGHFMPQSLLDSQFETLEEPVDEKHCLTLDASKSLTDIVQCVLERLTRDEERI